MGRRLFVAVELPEEAQTTLAEYGKSKRLHVNPKDQIHWTSPTLFHVTLKFIGNLSEDRRAELHSYLRSVATNIKPFSVRLDHSGLFPAKGNPTVLWVGSSGPNAELSAIASSIDEHCGTLGIGRETRPYAPHVTLARVKQAVAGQALRSLWCAPPGPAPACFDVHEIVMMDSRLTPAGAHYECLERFELRKI